MESNTVFISGKNAKADSHRGGPHNYSVLRKTCADFASHGTEL